MGETDELEFLEYLVQKASPEEAVWGKDYLKAHQALLINPDDTQAAARKRFAIMEIVKLRERNVTD